MSAHADMGARERMLGRLRAAGPAPRVDAAQHEAGLGANIDAYYDQRRPARTQAQLVEAMTAALTASHAKVASHSVLDWPQAVAQRLAAAGVKRIVLDPLSAEGARLAGALPDGIEAVAFDRPLEQWKTELFDSVDAGFTVARSGIAATGTLVIAPDAGSPRTVSLVPSLHIALVYADTLHPDLHAAVRAERWADGMPTNLVLVSGPSKTSDIQQTLAYGAHGPRWVWVIIVTGEEPL